MPGLQCPPCGPGGQRRAAARPCHVSVFILACGCEHSLRELDLHTSCRRGRNGRLCACFRTPAGMKHNTYRAGMLLVCDMWVVGVCADWRSGHVAHSHATCRLKYLKWVLQCVPASCSSLDAAAGAAWVAARGNQSVRAAPAGSARTSIISPINECVDGHLLCELSFRPCALGTQGALF